MPRNPYIAAWRTAERNRARTGSILGRIAATVGGAGVVALLVPLVRPVFLGFLDVPVDRWDGAFEGILIRAALLQVAVLTLDVYTALIRSPDRGILAVLPVDPAQVVSFEVLRTAVRRVWLPLATCGLLAPIAVATPLGWALGAGVIGGAYVLGLAASAAMHLFAVEVAASPRFAPLLDLVRGINTREQAAFIYAPGVVLAASAGVVLLAARGAEQAVSGAPIAALGLALPVLAAAIAWWRVAPLARLTWFDAGAIIADVDARYAALGEREEGTRVYLDWAVRWLPVDVARYALKDLRHGWRVRRTWVLGAWLAGAGVALAGWAGHPTAAANAAWLVAAAVWGVAGLGVVLDGDDPAFLRAWMPTTGRSGALARLFVLLAWIQGAIWLAVAAVALRHGGVAAGTVAATALATTVVAAPFAMLTGRLGTAGPWVYGPVAALAVGATAAWALTGVA